MLPGRKKKGQEEEQDAMAAILVSEVELAIRMKREEIKGGENKSWTGGVDYSWLSSTRGTSSANPELSVLEALQLQHLCKQVPRWKCSSVISVFRHRSDTMNVKPEDMATIMRQVVSEAVACPAAGNSGTPVRFRNRVMPQP